MALTAVNFNLQMSFSTALAEALGISGQLQSRNEQQPVSNSFAVGTGADQFTKYALLQGSVVAGAPVSYDFQSAVIDLVSGAASAWSLLRAYMIFNLSAAGNLLVGGGSNPIAHFTNARSIGPSTATNNGWDGHIRPDATGLPIVAATGDILKFDASAGTVFFKAHLWGN